MMKHKLAIIYLATLFAGTAGCIPEVPSIPTGASCTADGFVLRPVVNDPLDITTWEFVVDETGNAMTCVFT